MSETLAGKTVVVGGASRNLGALISESVAREGANVVVHFNRDSSAAKAAAVVAAVEKIGTRAVAHQGDLSTSVGVTGLFDVAETEFGQVDAVVNTAGKVIKKPMAEVTDNEYDEMFAVNSKAAFLVMREAAGRVADGGKIVTIVTSLLAAYAPGYSVYAGGKAPVEHFTRALSKELMGRRVSVNNVAPGPMDTPFFYPAETDESVAFHRSQAMGGHLTKIEDIAPIVRFLLTDGWWINGQTLFANGGYTTR